MKWAPKKFEEKKLSENSCKVWRRKQEVYASHHKHFESELNP